MKLITAFTLCIFLFYCNSSISQDNKPTQWVLLVYNSIKDNLLTKDHLVEKGFENEVIAENKSRIEGLEDPEIRELNDPSTFFNLPGLMSVESCSLDINNLKIEWSSSNTERIKSYLPFKLRKLDSKSELYKLSKFPQCIVASKSFFEKLNSGLSNHPNTPTVAEILYRNKNLIPSSLVRD